jgi:hypothetical protein
MVPAIGAYPSFNEDDPKLDSSDPREQLYNSHYNGYRNQIRQRLAWGMLAGLNVGLATGLATAYLPDQTVYGPSWQRVLMVDLAGVAGAIFATTIEICTRTIDRKSVHCADDSNNTRLNDRTARYALAGAGVGLLTGWLLTMSYDHNNQERPAPPLLSHIPLPGVVPVQSPYGTSELLPGLVSQGQF